MTYDHMGRFDDAIDQYKEAIALQPNMGILFNNLGISLYMKKEYEKAVQAYTEALKTDHSNRRIYNNLGLALSRLGRYQESLEAFKKGGDEASAQYNLGCIYMLEGKYKEAIQAFQKAIKSKPEFYVKAYDNMNKAKAALETLPPK